MHSDKLNNRKQSIKSDFSESGKVLSLLNFLEVTLESFSEQIQIKKNTDERILNQKLFRFLTLNNSLYYFVPENLDEHGENKSKPDLGVYEKIEVFDDSQIRFFDIECKRLYDETKSKQYVSGTTGGIQRFKENKHGVDLKQSAMIGYIEIEDFNFWQRKVNSWISDKNEHLKKIDIQKIAKYQSIHKRINNKIKSIKLMHFWLKITFTQHYNM